MIRTIALAAPFIAALASPLHAQDAATGTRGPALSISGKNPAAGEQRFTAYLTGYSYWDNTPPGSAEISKPVIHNRAGGTGTYNDPITIAVGHSISGGRQTLDFPPGTRFYLERLQKYAIVEDVCGDGNTPQNGPCHTGFKGRPWLDIYVGGKGAQAASETCMRRITAMQPMIMHPRRDYPVHRGEIVGSGCRLF
jgi:hypothetical protein